ncbi:MAG: response regulator [Campylobacterales bacterium]|nr:response regulator [Campylobacterales bacterium]
MYKILIADDVKNNRRAIKLALSDLEDEMDIEYFEAENGEESVALAKENIPDLIFMDVMMPIMDGVEATTEIVKEASLKDTIIIGITALDDEKTKQNMNQAGVRDFLTKPFDNQELYIRTKNYLELIETKKSTSSYTPAKAASITLYDDKEKIKSFRVVFKIDSPEALVDFWEYFYSYGEFDKSLLNDQVNLIVTVTKVLFKVNKISSFDIITEESDQHVYLTVWNSTFIKAAKKYFEKFSSDLQFIDDGEKLSFKVSKNINKIEQEVKTDTAPTQTKPTLVQEPTKEPEASSAQAEVSPPTIEIPQEARELVVYDFIDEDDLEDMQDIIGDLKSKLLLFGSGNLEPEDISDISNDLARISSKLKMYPQTFVIANAIDGLSDSMSEHIDSYIANSSSVAPLFVGFGNDIELWLNSLFFTGTEDLHFLDDTIVSNTETIKQFGTSSNNGAEEEELDDIFDF